MKRKLYHISSISDIESILKNGIISANESKNYNWEENKRAPNSYDVVYLFNPKTEVNFFKCYGSALIEVFTEARPNEFVKQDPNADVYEEYVTDRVDPSDIVAIYIPRILKERITVLSDETMKTITFCEFEADCWSDDKVYRLSSDNDNGILDRWSKTVLFEDVNKFNFFRGINRNRTMIDLDNIKFTIHTTEPNIF